MPSESLKYKKICGDHFDVSQFRNELRNSLNRNAVPKPFSPAAAANASSFAEKEINFSTAVSQHTSETALRSCSPPLQVNFKATDRTYSAMNFLRFTPPKELSIPHQSDPKQGIMLSPTLDVILNAESPSVVSHTTSSACVSHRRKRLSFMENADTTPRKKRLLDIIKNQHKDLNKRKRQLCYYKSKLQTTASKLDRLVKKTKNSTRTFCKTEMDVAKSLYFASPAAYKTLRKQGVILPGVSTVQKKLNLIKVEAGFSTNIIQSMCSHIRQKYAGKNNEMCVLLFDEMAIKKNLDYNKSLDLIEGFEDLGERRSVQYASEAMVFMATGIMNKWKLPLGYKLISKTMKVDDIKQCIYDIVKILKLCGMEVKMVVCDQGSSNRSAITRLGVTAEHPFFVTPDGDRIGFMYDVPHLIKSVRNQLLSSDFVLDDKIISWRYIKGIYHIDRECLTKALPKINDIHITPNSFQKMKCKYAIQVFSNTMAAAIRTAVAVSYLPSEASDTADFIELMNNMFDVLNTSKFGSANTFQVPLSAETPHLFRFLRTAAETFSKLTKSNGKVPPCFKGVILSINSVIAIFETLKDVDGFNFLLTRRLCQDPLENFFSLMRSKGGFNRNPTARSFRLSFRHTLISKMHAGPLTGNCEHDAMHLESNLENCLPNILQSVEDREDDGELTALLPDDADEDIHSKTDLKRSLPYSLQSKEDDVTDIDDDDQVATPLPKNDANEEIHLEISRKSKYEMCSQRYTSGYVARHVISKFKCPVCKQLLLQPNSNEHFIDTFIKQKSANFKKGKLEESGLCVPSKVANEIIHTSFRITRDCYNKLKYRRNVSKLIINKVKSKIDVTYPNFFDTCKQHRNYLITFAVQLYLMKLTTWESRKIRFPTSRIKANPKLNILCHN